MNEDTPPAESPRTLRGLARRWIIFTVLIGALFVVTTALGAIWSPLAWLVPIGAAVLLVILVARALTVRS